MACGPFECWRFTTARGAARHVLRHSPLVLGIGEAHALAGLENVATTARRFTEELLPELAPRSSHLLVELLNPNPSCREQVERTREAHEPVTREQSSHNQSDYVALGHRARELGVEPFVLTPTCEEFRAITAAGERAIEQTLATIARITERMARAALARNREAGKSKMVLAYGGALHNDMAPSAARADWSYARALAAHTGGRYIELDLIVRELIKDNEVWRALPWYAHFDAAAYPDSCILAQTGPRSYVLFFARQAVAPEAAPTHGSLN